MKIRRIGILCLLAALLAAGCASAPETAEEPETGRESLEHTEEAEEELEEPKLSVRIFHGDSQAEQLLFTTVELEEVTPEYLLLQLFSNQVLPDTVSIRSFEEEQQEEKLLLKLDLSGNFGTYLSSQGTAGENIVLGSLVNTFLDAYQAEGIRITVEGKTLETGHAIYEDYLNLYPFVEASYSVSEQVIRGENFEIYYPKLTGLAVQETEEKWNGIFEEGARNLADRVKNGGECMESYFIKTMNDELLSVLFEGTCMEEGAPYPYQVRYTYNIDMKTGESIRLANYKDVDSLAELLLNGSGYETAGVPEDFAQRLSILYGSSAQLADVLRDYDYREGQEQAAGYSYREDGRTHLCMEVPHMLGDYIDLLLTE